MQIVIGTNDQGETELTIDGERQIFAGDEAGWALAFQAAAIALVDPDAPAPPA